MTTGHWAHLDVGNNHYIRLHNMMKHADYYRTNFLAYKSMFPIYIYLPLLAELLWRNRKNSHQNPKKQPKLLNFAQLSPLI